MYYRQAAALAEQAGDSQRWGSALLNLSDVLAVDDPVAAAGLADQAADHLRRVGGRDALAFAVGNLAVALISSGDWDRVGAVLTRAVEGDGLSDMEHVALYRAWIASLQGDAQSADPLLAGLESPRISEEPQYQSQFELVEAFSAVARHETAAALAHGRIALHLVDRLQVSTEGLRWIWPLAARCAYELHDNAVSAELLAILDAHQPGQLAPMLRAERDLVRARLAAGYGDAGAGALFTAAVGALRTMSTPYHLAHGLLDYAEYLVAGGDTGAAQGAVEEARDIAQRLGCPPLLERADRVTAGTEVAT